MGRSRGRGSRRRRGEGNGWEGWGGYMQAKIQKLQGQFEDCETNKLQKQSDIFRGIAIHVNGYTNPTWSVLRDLMRAHGGVYQHYYSRSIVTHVIATHLASSKAASLSPDVKVCSPDWITDSINAKKLLPYEDYLIYTAKTKKQPGLKFNTMSKGCTETHTDGNTKTSNVNMKDKSETPSENGDSSETLGINNQRSETPGDNLNDNSSEASSDNLEESIMCLFDDEDQSSGNDLFDDSKNFETVTHEEEENQSNSWDPPEKSVEPFSKDSEDSEESKVDEASVVSKGQINEVTPTKSSITFTSILPTTTSNNSNAYCAKPTNENLITPTISSRNISSVTSVKQNNSSSRKPTQTFRSPSKAGDPSFIGEFYTNSRLHYLSTWGAEFKAYVNVLQTKGTSFPGREKLTKIVQNNSMLNTTNRHAQRVVMHIDMDSFFVAVGLRNHPELKGKPVAVTHSRGKGAKERPGTDLQYEKSQWKNRTTKSKRNKAVGELDRELNPDVLQMLSDSEDEGGTANTTMAKAEETFHSMAEIASCSYEARQAGVKNGMFMGTAKKLCPDLLTIPYDFEGYRQVSQQLYDIVASYTHDIEAVSCDEMLVDLTELLESTGASPLQFAALLRQEIRDATQCNASAGLGPNILIARMATRQAKPNGQHMVPPADILAYIRDRNINELPGVGYAMTKKLKSMSVETCGDLQALSLQVLQKEFGPKTGQSLYRSCRGQDDRPIRVERERKSVSAEINYGIRFTKEHEVEKFLQALAEEVHNRMANIKVKAKTFTLKLKVRSADAPRETAKFLGHGICDNVAKSVTVPLATDSAEIIARECLVIMKQLKIPPDDLRGIGIQGSKLESATLGQQPVQAPGMQSILNFATKVKDKVKVNEHGEGRNVSLGPRVPESNDKVLQENNKTKEQEVNIQGIHSLNQDPSKLNSKEDSALQQTFRNRKRSLPPLPCLPDLSSSFSSQQGSFRAVTPASKGKKLQDREDFFYSPSQVDLDVLNELPDDIRKQIERGMQQRQSRKPVIKTRRPSGTSKPESHRQNLQLHSRSDNTTSETKIHDSQEAGCSHWMSNDEESQDIQMYDSDSNSLPTVEVQDGKQDTELSFSQVDPEVLKELPEEIRIQIEHDMKQRRSHKYNVQTDRPKACKSDNHAILSKPPARNSQEARRSHWKTNDENSRDSLIIDEDSNSRCDVGEQGLQRRNKHPIVALPAFSEIDPSFLEALPVELRAEIQNAYIAEQQKLNHQRETRSCNSKSTIQTSPLKIFDNIMAAGRGSPAKTSPGKSPGKAQARGRGRGSRGRGSRGTRGRGRARTALMPLLSPRKAAPDVANIQHTPEKQNEIEVEETVVHRPPDLCGATELTDIKSLLMEWMDSSPVPEEEDTDRVVEYLNRLIQEKYLDLCHLILKFFKRHIPRKNCQAWSNCMESMLMRIQNVVIAFYGAPLKL